MAGDNQPARQELISRPLELENLEEWSTGFPPTLGRVLESEYRFSKRPPRRISVAAALLIALTASLVVFGAWSAFRDRRQFQQLTAATLERDQVAQQVVAAKQAYANALKELNQTMLQLMTARMSNSSLEESAKVLAADVQRLEAETTKSAALVSRLELESQRASLKISNLQAALAVLKPTEYEQKQNLFVSFVAPDAVAEPRTGKVRVVVRNVQFACRLRWIVNDKEDVHSLPMGETELELPIGSPTTAFVESLHTANWLQAVYVAVIRDKERISPSGTALGKLPLTLMDKDIVVLHVEQPLPPWNAVCVPVRGEWMMITLERPWADFRVEPWKQKTLKEPEELPNSALFWKRDGTAATAKHLAAYFLAHRADKGAWGRFRTPETRHFGIVVRAGQDQVSEAMQTIEQPELERAIVTALELLKKQQPPLGPSIATELERAGEILKQEGIAIQE